MTNLLFISVEDLLGEGVNEVIERAQSYGVTGLAVSCAYHESRDVTPHGVNRVTVRRDGVYFPAKPGMFSADGLTPNVIAAVGDGLANVIHAAEEHGMSIAGWAIFMHNSSFGESHPDVMQVNCFGDRGGPGDLCPASPAARLYATELACAVAEQGISTIIAESLHYGLFGHGYHHERCFVQLGAVEKYLLGLCFCHECIDYVSALGVDACGARVAAQTVIERQLAGARTTSDDLSLATLAEVAGDNVVDYVLARRDVVSSLVMDVAKALKKQSARLVFLDMMGAEQGYGDGEMRGAAGVDLTWQFGIEPSEISSQADYAILGYSRDSQRIGIEVKGYRAVLDDDSSLRVVLRPGAPDCDSSDNLREKLKVAIDNGADSVDFYHYGLYTFSELKRLSDILGFPQT